MKITTTVLGEMQNKNMAEFAENSLIWSFYEFLKYVYSNVNSICHDFGMQLLNKNIKKLPLWYLGDA